MKKILMILLAVALIPTVGFAAKIKVGKNLTQRDRGSIRFVGCG